MIIDEIIKELRSLQIEACNTSGIFDDYEYGIYRGKDEAYTNTIHLLTKFKGE